MNNSRHNILMPANRILIRKLGILLVLISLFTAAVSAQDRVRPRALAVSPDRSCVVTANRIAGTLSFVSLPEMQLHSNVEVREVDVGNEPLDVLWLSDSIIAVAVYRDQCVKLFEREGSRLQILRTISLSGHPVSMTHARNCQELLVSLQHPDSVQCISVDSGALLREYHCGNLPRFLVLSPDETWFCVTCELPGSLYCFDRNTGQLLSRQEAHQTAFNLGQPELFSGSEVIVPLTINRDFPITEGNLTRGWAVNNRLAKFNVPSGNELEQSQFGLDVRGHGVADLTLVRSNPAGTKLAVLASGVQELILLKTSDLIWPTSGVDDFAPHYLTETPGILTRIKIPGRPIDLEFLDNETVLVANEMQDSLCLIDLKLGSITKELKLSHSNHKSEIARGEQIFYDGLRSKDGWMSCHTCHYDGHTSGQMFDTLNDVTYDTKKLTLSLHDVAKTEPWTWHGWQPDLTESMSKSLRETMHDPHAASFDDARALASYLETLKPISATKLPASVDREAGQELFYGKGGCISCHQEPDFSSGLRYAVGRVESHSIYQVFNPPALRGISSRRRYLHHGRAHSLKQVLTLYHRPEETSGAELTEDEIEQLVNFLSGL
ncbi:Cytochrome c [Rubinisphaera italica]|uniref:Cytochrome c n=2 Tax=Rubinisphaera italica TaxID=2527969 RepID=A0A5C5XIB8_9PLAN|nr:Cytochrome c [Rubinisphaera italica]